MTRPARAPLPSMGALAAFEAAARHGSFTRAAEELALTQGAVSRQVAALEALVGAPLFERVRQRVALTPAGAAYAVEVRAALSALSAATLSVMAFRGAGGVLELAILPTFGTRWLIPRLPRFLEAHPNVTINFSTRLVPFDFARERLDAAIHFGGPTWPGARLHRLMGEEIVPVASPGLVARAGLAEPKDVLGVPLLQQATRPRAWEQWLAEAGLSAAQATPGPRFEQFAMVAQAAVAGLGLAIVPRFLVEEELRAGALVAPFDRPSRSQEAYWLVYPEEKAALPAVAAFRAWLLAEVGAPLALPQGVGPAAAGDRGGGRRLEGDAFAAKRRSLRCAEASPSVSSAVAADPPSPPGKDKAPPRSPAGGAGSREAGD